MPTRNHIRPIDRFFAAFEHREADRVPMFECIANASLYRRYIGKDNFHSAGGPNVELARRLGLDAAFTHCGGYTSLIGRHHEWRGENEFTDEFGVRHQVSPASWPLAMAVGHPFADRDAWTRIPHPDPLAEWRFQAIREAAAEAHRDKEDDLAVVAGVRGAFAVMFIGMGFDNLAVAVYDDPDLLREMSAYFTDFWIKASVRAVEAGADAIFIANDLGFNTNTLVSPDTLRDIFLPDLKRQVRAIKATGTRVILHSCGCINPVLPDLVDMGIDGLNPLQNAAGMDIAQVKRDYGDRLTILGNVDATNVLTTKNPAEIEAAVKQVLRAAGHGGGLVLASDHSLHGAIPPENIEHFIAAGRKFGAYPLQA